MTEQNDNTNTRREAEKLRAEGQINEYAIHQLLNKIEQRLSQIEEKIAHIGPSESTSNQQVPPT